MMRCELKFTARHKKTYRQLVWKKRFLTITLENLRVNFYELLSMFRYIDTVFPLLLLFLFQFQFSIDLYSFAFNVLSSCFHNHSDLFVFENFFFTKKQTWLTSARYEKTWTKTKQHARAGFFRQIDETTQTRFIIRPTLKITYLFACASVCEYAGDGWMEIDSCERT